MKFRLVMLAALALNLAGCDDKKPAEAAKPAPQKPSPQKVAVTDGPPLVNGVYVEQNACPGEGCTFDFFWRATARIELRERPDKSSKIVATMSPKELGRVIGAEQYIVPWRGVTTRDVTFYGDRSKEIAVKKGETVYRLGYSGEGVYYFWHRGAIATNSLDDNDFVRWDAGTDTQPKPLWWVRITNASGQTGWTLDTGKFECGNDRSGDENCRAVPPSPAK